MDHIYAALLFVFGTIIGSFLNVCAYRIPKGESVAYPPSRCPSCGSAIAPYDNIPIASYVLLGGRCRNCKSKISMKYPLVEAMTGMLWAAAYYHFGLSIQLSASLFFITVLVVLSVIDYETKTIPNRLLLPAMAISLAMLILYITKIDTIPVVSSSGIMGAITGFLAGGGLLYMIAALAPLILKKEAMGGGDIKLAAFMGLYLGGYVFIAIFIGSFLGALVGAALMASNKMSPKDMIPFGPFLAAGALITMFIGPQLWTTYLRIAGLG